MKFIPSRISVYLITVFISASVFADNQNIESTHTTSFHPSIESAAVNSNTTSTSISKFNNPSQPNKQNNSTNNVTVKESSAEPSKVININSAYITPNNFLQDPYNGLAMGGGRQRVSNYESNNFIANGTWNAMGGSIFNYANRQSGKVGFPVFAYGANVFAQTGYIAGFSAGGLATIANPFFADKINPSTEAQNINFIPANQEVTLSEAYLEYQHRNIIQVDTGLIGINNSPWLSNNYYKDDIAPGANYQGIMINVYPGSGWLLTGTFFNASQLIGNSGFTPYTFYNTSVDSSSGLFTNNNGTASNNTVAVGSNYTTWDNRYNLRLWGYQFENYGNMLYSDTNIKFEPTQNLSFNISAQGGIEGQTGSSSFTNTGYGNISSNFAGLQLSMNYQWFSLNLGFNNIWGPDNAYGNGAISTPYTYGFATDPLYTTPYISGLNDLNTAGKAYKISPTLTFMDGNLTFSPAWTTFRTTAAQWDYTNEYDFITTYSVPQIRGLSFFGVYANQRVPVEKNNAAITRIFASYIY